MKQFFFIAISLLVLANLKAQNVGIGTSTPAYPLTVVAAGSKGITQKDGALEIGFYTGPTSAYLQTWTNHPLHFATNNGSAQLTLATNGNFGVGTTTPSTKLHVTGNTSLMGDVGVGTTTPSSKLHVIGNTSLMGDVGINTTSPTADLDINGSLRIRNGSPKEGSILTSIDANGNAVWKEDRVAFKVYGQATGQNVITDSYVERVHFGGEKFDLGNDYTLLPANTTPNDNSSTFIAPVSGIYHFDLNIELDADGMVQDIEQAYLSLLVKRNGVEIILTEISATRIISGEGNIGMPDNAGFSLSTTESLLANDKVYVTVVHHTGTNCTIEWGEKTWFSGFLVKAE